ncbi:hypothetical protein KCP77_11895 [Salmonella enterica subsp. enterica]|nr:hypothetical protein KCP77_11895 [Salmonella enterica subsp. enterica]
MKFRSPNLLRWRWRYRGVKTAAAAARWLAPAYPTRVKYIARFMTWPATWRQTASVNNDGTE